MANIIIGVIIAAFIIRAVWVTVRMFKKGGCSCGSCDSCEGCAFKGSSEDKK